MYKSKTFILLIVTTLVMLGWWIVLQILPTKDAISNYLFNAAVALIYLLGGILTEYYATNVPLGSALRKIFIYFGLALISWGIAGCIWSFYNLVLHVESPYPTIADFFFLSCTFFTAIGLWYMFDHFNFTPKRGDIYLSLVIVVAMYYLVFFVLMPPDYTDQLPFITIIFNYSYPLVDTFLLSIGSIIIITIRKLGYGLGSIIAYLLMQSTADILFTWRQAKEMYWNGDISDLFYVLSAIFLILGMIKMYFRFKNKLNLESN